MVGSSTHLNPAGGETGTKENSWPDSNKLGHLVQLSSEDAFMMTEFAILSAPSGAEEKVRFVGAELRAELLRSYETDGWMPVCVEIPGAQGRGRLGLVLEEAIERSLELRGACPPGIGASADSDASLSDQLYRARLLGAPGLAIAIENLGSIANRAGALDAEDSAVLRWWIMTARERPLRLLFDPCDRNLGVYTAPALFWQLVRDSADDAHGSAPPPVSEELASSLVSMRAAAAYLAGTPANSGGSPGSAPEAEAASEHSGTQTEPNGAAEPCESASSVPEARLHPGGGAVEARPQDVIEARPPGDTETTDCSAVVSEAAAEPAPPAGTLTQTVVEPKLSPIEDALLTAARTAAANTMPTPAASTIRATPETAGRGAPLHPEAAGRWRDWMRQLDEARGPKPLAMVEQLFVNAYVPLADAAARGLAPPEALEVLETWSASFARSYSDAFDALRLRGKRPMMVLDVVDVSIRLARLHGARSVQLILVDGLRFDLGLRVEQHMRAALHQQAAMTERLVLWSALPSTTSTQLDLIARGAEGLKNFEPPADDNDFVAHGRAASTLRRVRAGSRDVLKLDLVESRLNEPGIANPEQLDELAELTARSLTNALQKFAPRTLAMVFGDHGFASNPRAEGSKARHGGASPEEILVPAFAWLVGATH